MPTVEDYAPHAPFTLDELVVAANRILGNDPKLSVKDRTIRYYISQRLLPPPSGGPKFARYGVEHLRRLVAIRRWLAEGLSLEEAAARLGQGEHGGEPAQMVFEARVERPMQRHSSDGITQRSVRRIYLTRHSVLEVSEEADLGRELDAVSDVLARIRQDLHF